MKSPPIEKYAFNQGREAPHFSMEMSSVFGKKVGDFNKKEISKPYKSRAGDSERLLLYQGGFLNRIE